MSSANVKKWRAQMLKLEGAVQERIDPFASVCRTPSPSVNYIFGKTHGLPFGYTCIFYGPYKGGKTLLSNLMIGDLHRSDPDAMVYKFDAEFRSEAQLTENDDAKFGVDPERLIVVEGNSPAIVFNQISKDVNAMCQNGIPIKMIVIDSISSIVGRRELENGDVEKMTVGDQAQTIQIGLKMILPVIRKHKIALVIIAQARAEMDQWVAKRNGHAYKMAGSFGLKHMAEYFVFVDRNETKDGKADALGNEFVDQAVEQMDGKHEKVASKHRVKMQGSSLGPEGRTAEFTFHKDKGLINTWEEVARLALGHNIVAQDSAVTLSFQGETFRGKSKFLEAVRDNPTLCSALELKIRELDSKDQLQGVLTDIDIDLPE